MLVFSVCGSVWVQGFNGLRVVGFHGYDNYCFMVLVIDGVYGWLLFLLLIFVYG